MQNKTNKMLFKLKNKKEKSSLFHNLAQFLKTQKNRICGGYTDIEWKKESDMQG